MDPSRACVKVRSALSGSSSWAESGYQVAVQREERLLGRAVDGDRPDTGTACFDVTLDPCPASNGVQSDDTHAAWRQKWVESWKS
jgi:hypothetical protein